MSRGGVRYPTGRHHGNVQDFAQVLEVQAAAQDARVRLEPPPFDHEEIEMPRATQDEDLVALHAELASVAGCRGLVRRGERLFAVFDKDPDSGAVTEARRRIAIYGKGKL